MKNVFYTKIWFVKTSTRIVKYKSRVVKLNPVMILLSISTFSANLQSFKNYFVAPLHSGIIVCVI